MIRPVYIEQIEKNDGIFSSVKLNYYEGKFLDFIKSLKVKVVYEELEIDLTGEIDYNETILESPQKFYIHIISSGATDVWDTTIYYKPEQFKELKFFINNLNKQYKNATNNN